MIERLNASLTGRYRIERELGEGGMATVFLAEDLRHGRNVAVKVLRPELAAVVGAERFLSEIRTTAALQHPHILPLHDSGEADSFLFYVMPYVEGESLRERLDRERQLPVDEATAIARKVASALEYAHEQGVIHRDIKPANILLSRGEPLVADFGIALALSEAGGGRITETGLSLGTPHYMSPEQAAGERTLDPRSDVYALGCVLYEMLAGEPPFPGPTAQAVLARILMAEPRRVTEARRTVPPHLDAAVAKSLEKLPADRFESVRAFRQALDDEGLRHTTARRPERTTAGSAVSEVSGRRGLWGGPAPLLTVGALAVLASVAAVTGWLVPEPPARVARFTVELTGGVITRYGRAIDIAPDGSRIAYVGSGNRIWMREIDELDAVEVPGTENAFTPFFSPNGESLGYASLFGSDPGLRTVSLGGAPPTRITASARPGGSWGDDGSIVFTHDEEGALYRVRPGEGEPELVLAPPGGSGETYLWPEVLPGSRAVVFTLLRDDPANSAVAAVSLEGGELQILTRGLQASYAGGHLFFVTPERTLMTAPFDADALELRGAARPLAGDVALKQDGAADFAVSAEGTLVYLQGASDGVATNDERLVWVDREGNEEPTAPELVGEFVDFDHLSLSPDGSRIAVTYQDGTDGSSSTTWDVWIYDVRQSEMSKLTFGGRSNEGAVWSSDGRFVAFTSDRDGEEGSLYRQPVDRSGAPERIVSVNGRIHPALHWSPDGQWVAFEHRGADGGSDILYSGIEGGEAQTFLATEANEGSPRISPDGRWLAYVSFESGVPELYVQPFPDGGRAWQVSRGGGYAPLWSPAGNELFYVDGESRLVSVRVQLEPTLLLQEHRTLFSVMPYELSNSGTEYDLAPDGRFLFVKEPVGSTLNRVVVVLNVFGALEGERR